MLETYLLQCLAEEASEVSLAVTECVHYGFNRKRYRDGKTNLESLIFEINDMYGAARLLIDNQVLPAEALQERAILECFNRSFPESNLRLTSLSLSERATKVHLAVSKALRFGIDHKANSRYMSNRDFVVFRLNHAFATMHNMKLLGYLPQDLISEQMVKEKAQKVLASYDLCHGLSEGV